MKTYSIGRGQDCDIIIADNSDVVSRHHAILTIYPTGKMCITDQSTNGTYVNGIMISPNVAVPVTRKDSISFAHVSKLDWRSVPKTTPVWFWAIIAVAATAIIAFGTIKIVDSLKKRPGGGGHVEVNATQPTDSTKAIQKDTIIIRDTVKIENPKENGNNTQGSVDNKKDKKKDKKEKEEQKEKKDSTVQSRRAIG